MLQFNVVIQLARHHKNLIHSTTNNIILFYFHLKSSEFIDIFLYN